MTTELRSSACYLALQSAAADVGAGEWLHLLPAGTFSGADGRGPYVATDPGKIIDLSMADGKIAIDENHSIDLAGPKGLPSPARGWVVEMQARADGIWGRVEWTPAGQALRSEQAYRGISPAVHVRKGTSPAQVAAIARASLTNDPNFPLQHLHQKGLDAMSLSPELLKRLGLAADADQKAVEAAIGRQIDQVETHAKTVAQIAKAAGAKDGATGDELVTHLQAVSRAGDATQLAATVVELQSKYDKLAADTAEGKAEAYVDGQIAAGKPIKALRDHYIARHQKDASAVETELNAMASVHSGAVVPPRRGKAPTADVEDTGDIVAKAELHQKQHGGSWTDAVLAVTGGN